MLMRATFLMMYFLKESIEDDDERCIEDTHNKGAPPECSYTYYTRDWDIFQVYSYRAMGEMGFVVGFCGLVFGYVCDCVCGYVIERGYTINRKFIFH